MGSQMHTSCYVEFRMAMSPQRVIRSTSCLVLGRVFGVSGSNGAISGCIKPKMAAMTRHDSKYRQEPSDDAFCQITLAPCVGAKNGTVFVEPLTLSNINRFSKFSQCQNQEKICNNIIAKDHTTPQVCRYTTL